MDTKETIFMYKIDHQFPYLDTEKAISLINESLELQADSTYKIIEELCRIPRSLKGDMKVLEQANMLLDYLDSKFPHPLKEMVMNVARQLNNGLRFTTKEVLDRFEIIRSYQWQTSALNIVYFSNGDDDFDQIDNAYEEILTYWRQIDDVNKP